MAEKIKMTQMTEKQKETFDRMTKMVASFFPDAAIEEGGDVEAGITYFCG